MELLEGVFPWFYNLLVSDSSQAGARKAAVYIFFEAICVLRRRESHGFEFWRLILSLRPVVLLVGALYPLSRYPKFTISLTYRNFAIGSFKSSTYLNCSRL